MIKKVLFIFFISVIIAGVLVFVNSRGRGLGDNDSFTFDTQEEQEETIVTPLLIIEIREDKIYYDNEEITIDRLEQILITNPNEIWEVKDAHQADKAVFETVTDLLTRLDIVFRER